jgi:autotransporter-associated beta strand protein
MKNIPSRFLSRLGLALSLAVVPTLHAELAAPYTPDSFTSYLFHFNEPSGSSIATNLGTAPYNAVAFDGDPYAGDGTNQPTITTLFGAAAYPGFGTAANIGAADLGLGVDRNGDGAYMLDDNAPLSPDRFLDHGTIYGTGNRFTLEAMIKLPAITGAQREIICTDNSEGTAANRGFQFRVNTSGQLEFNCIGGAGGALTPAIPTSGPHAFVADEWFHVAAVYDGGRLSLYWTRVDGTHTTANLIAGPVPRNVDFNDDAPIVIGNEARVVGTVGSTEGLRGQIDQVRISQVARAPGEMLFATTNVTIVRQPLHQGVDYGGTILLSVGASSASAPGYQWRKNGTPLPGATANVLLITNAAAVDAGHYDCVVTNAIGSAATSAVATVTIGAANFLAHRYSFTADASDSVGGAHGTNFGTISGGLLQLDGFSGYVQLPSGIIPTNHGAVTIEVWGDYGVIANNTMLFAFGDVAGTVGTNYLFCTPHSGVNTRIAMTAGTGGTEQQVVSPGVLDNRAVHLVAVFNPLLGHIALYTNGVSAGFARTNFGVPLAALVNNLSYIGRSLYAADPLLAGNIDEFRIYRGALSPASVAKAFLQGPAHPLSDGPVALLTSPTNQTVASGLPVTFTSLFSGREPVTYQWFTNGLPVSGATNASYTFTATVPDNGSTFQVYATNNVGGTNYFAASSTATLTVLVPPTLAWLGGVNGDWDTTTANWTNEVSAAVVAWSPFSGARFDARGAGQPVVNLTVAANPLEVIMNDSGTYTLTSYALNGSLTGIGSLTKSGSGTLVIDVTNTMSGPEQINAGTLQIGNSSTSGGLGTGPVTNNGALVFQRADEFTVPNEISGSGTVAQAGFGGVILTGSNSYAGLTTVSAGTLKPRHSSALGTTAAGTQVTVGGQVYVDVNINLEGEPFTLNGNPALRKGGAGVSTLGGAITLASDTGILIDGGATLNLTASNGITSAGANLLLDGAANSFGFVAGPINLGGGAGTLSKAGSGTWTLGGSNAFKLDVIPAGTLVLSNNHALGTNLNVVLSSTTGGPGLTGTRLTLAGGVTFGASRSLTMPSSGAGTIRSAFFSTGAGVTNTWNGPVSLNGDFDLGNTIGFGVDANNTFVINGTITAEASFPGKLLVRGNAAGTGYLNGNILLAPGTGQFQVDDGSTWVLSGPGNTWLTTIFAGNGTLRLGVHNGLPAGTVLTVGNGTANRLDLAGFNQHVGNLDIPGGGLLITNSSAANASTLTLALPGAATYGGSFGDGAKALNVSLTSGTLVLTNPVSLNLTKSAINIASGAMLQLDYTGTNTIGGLVLGGSAQAPGLYNSTTSPAFLAGTGNLLVVPPVATYPTNITVSVSGTTLNISWPGTHLGWILQSQTNGAAVGITTNWVDLPATASVTNTSIPIHPANPTVFFRLRKP